MTCSSWPGKEDDISSFAQMELPSAREGIPTVFSRMFSRFRERRAGGRAGSGPDAS